jgi:hypothetical protein
MVPLRKSLALLVLVLLAFTFHTPTTSAALAKAEPDLSLKASVAGDKLAFSKWAGLSTVDVAMPAISGFTDYRYETIQLTDGYEVNLILNKPPPTNIFYYPITVKNAEFYYQPPLTPEEVAQGCVRPENVVGSYAVYGPKKDNEYGTGKIMHIYRPKVTDAKGAWVWGALDYKDGVLSVTVDPVWLSKAVYPVTIDPTFGYTSQGASSTTIGVGSAIGGLYNSPASSGMYGVDMRAYIINGNGHNVKMGIWVGSAGGALITNGLTPAAAGVANGWVTSTYSTQPSISASTTYMLGILCDDAGSSVTKIACDTTGGLGKLDSSNAYAAPGNFDWDSQFAYKFSIYVTYTSAPTITSSTITDMDDTDNLYAMKKYYTFQTEITDTDGATDIKAISVRGMQGANVRWLVNATSLDGVPAYAIVTGASTIDLDSGSCSFGEAGNVGTLTLKIRFEWDATNEEDCELAVWASDVGGATVGWTTVQTDYFDVISRLVTVNHAANTTSTTINMPISVSGDVRYATTATGDLASSSYPPDAQFTAVSIQDDQSVIVGTNSTIINGAYYVSFLSASTLRTTYYYAYLDMAPDYTDGLAPDGDYTYVITGATFPFVDFLSNAFAFFGLAGAVVGTIYTTVLGFTVWFYEAASLMVSFITQIMTFIVFVGGAVVNWLARMVTFIITLLTVISSLFDGTYTAGLPNLWAVFNVSAWIDAVPVIVFILWYDSIGRRARKSGQNSVELVIRDLQIVTYIVGELWNWSFTVFNFVVNMLSQLASRF